MRIKKELCKVLRPTLCWPVQNRFPTSKLVKNHIVFFHKFAFTFLVFFVLAFALSNCLYLCALVCCCGSAASFWPKSSCVLAAFSLECGSIPTSFCLMQSLRYAHMSTLCLYVCMLVCLCICVHMFLDVRQQVRVLAFACY